MLVVMIAFDIENVLLTICVLFSINRSTFERPALRTETGK
jgi:hypothetical protein